MIEALIAALLLASEGGPATMIHVRGVSLHESHTGAGNLCAETDRLHVNSSRSGVTAFLSACKRGPGRRDGRGLNEIVELDSTLYVDFEPSCRVLLEEISLAGLNGRIYKAEDGVEVYEDEKSEGRTSLVAFVIERGSLSRMSTDATLVLTSRNRECDATIDLPLRATAALLEWQMSGPLASAMLSNPQ